MELVVLLITILILLNGLNTYFLYNLAFPKKTNKLTVEEHVVIDNEVEKAKFILDSQEVSSRIITEATKSKELNLDKLRNLRRK